MRRRDSRLTTAIDTLEPRQLMAATTPLRIAAGSAGYVTDSIARTFAPSLGRFSGGRDEVSPAVDIANTNDDALFVARRIGTHFSLNAPVASGNYTLWVEFAEPTATTPGQRVFDVTAEGGIVADDLDPFARGGNGAFAVAKDVTISDGTLNVGFDASVGEAFVNTVVLMPTEVPPESQPYDPTRNTTDGNNVVLSAHRLAQIGLGITLFANENRGRFPQTLTPIVTDQEMPLEILSDPRSATRLPRGELTLIEADAYARTLNDYVYRGAGMNNTAMATTVVAYENPDRVAGDLNILYGDGHVALLTRADAARVIGFSDAPPSSTAMLSPKPVDAAVLQSQANLRAIAYAAALYTNEHGGRYPADIGALARYNNAWVFSNPRLGSAAAPMPPTNATIDERAAWANLHSDYSLLRPSARTFYLGRSDVTLSENPAGLTSGLNLAFDDGSVSFRETRWAFETLAPVLPPLVLESAFDVDSGTLRVQFDEDVSASLAAGDLVITNTTTGKTIPTSSMGVNFDFTTLTAVFTLNSAFPDGDYVATLAAGSVADAAGNLLKASTSFSFFSLAGDADHDRDVDFADLIILAQHYGKTGQSYSQGNLNRDSAGRVDFSDLVILAQHYNAVLPAITTRKPAAVRQAAIVGIV